MVPSSGSMQVTCAPTSASSRPQTAAAEPPPIWTTLNPANSVMTRSYASARSSTRATCSASRWAPSAIWWRQLVPSATISVSASASRTARQQRQLGHLHRDVVVLGLVAEAAGHAAAARLDRLDLRARARASAPSRTARHRAERLLVAVAVQQRFLLRQRLQRRARAGPPSFSRARNSSNRQRVSASSAAASPGQHRQEFVAQREQARRLEPDDRHAARDVRRSASSMRRASRFASSTRPAARKVRPQHSGRAPIVGRGDVHACSRRPRARASAACAFSGSK